MHCVQFPGNESRTELGTGRQGLAESQAKKRYGPKKEPARAVQDVCKLCSSERKKHHRNVKAIQEKKVQVRTSPSQLPLSSCRRSPHSETERLPLYRKADDDGGRADERAERGD